MFLKLCEVVIKGLKVKSSIVEFSSNKLLRSEYFTWHLLLACHLWGKGGVVRPRSSNKHCILGLAPLFSEWAMELSLEHAHLHSSHLVRGGLIGLGGWEAKNSYCGMGHNFPSTWLAWGISLELGVDWCQSTMPSILLVSVLKALCLSLHFALCSSC